MRWPDATIPLCQLPRHHRTPHHHCAHPLHHLFACFCRPCPSPHPKLLKVPLCITPSLLPTLLLCWPDTTFPQAFPCQRCHAQRSRTPQSSSLLGPHTHRVCCVSPKVVWTIHLWAIVWAVAAILNAKSSLGLVSRSTSSMKPTRRNHAPGMWQSSSTSSGHMVRLMLRLWRSGAWRCVEVRGGGSFLCSPLVLPHLAGGDVVQLSADDLFLEQCKIGEVTPGMWPCSLAEMVLWMAAPQQALARVEGNVAVHPRAPILSRRVAYQTQGRQEGMSPTHPLSLVLPGLLLTYSRVCHVDITPSWVNSSDAAMTIQTVRRDFTSQNKVRITPFPPSPTQ